VSGVSRFGDQALNFQIVKPSALAVGVSKNQSLFARLRTVAKIIVDVGT
jgi:hypothetical protein